LLGNGAAIFNESLKKLNAFGMPMGSAGALGGGWFNRDINAVEDLAGLKIRTNGLGAQIFARLGAVPQQLNSSEITAALQNGTIDAASLFQPYDDEKLGLSRAAKTYYTPGWWDRSATLHLLVNLDAWGKLSKSYQAIVTQAAAAANGWMLAKYDNVNAPALKRMVAAGTVVKPFSQPVMEAFQKAAGDHNAELAGQNLLFKKALDSMTAFRSELLPWWQMSDYAMDSFMVSQRGKG